ncbi:hypothetical protein NGM36_29560 [Streptomyces mutabilis]|nr:hypothetical protein [Streptomyces mutabilis]
MIRELAEETGFARAEDVGLLGELTRFASGPAVAPGNGPF